MQLQVPICPSTTLAPSVCTQLQEQGLYLTDSTIIGRNLLFNGPVRLYQHSTFLRARIDAYSVVKSDCTITTSCIGRYCTISSDVELGLGQHDVFNLSSSSAFQFNSPFVTLYPLRRLSTVQRSTLEETNQVTLEHDVYIGPHCFIVGNVTIGTGAVIESGSVISRDVPPYAIVAGAGGGSQSKGIIKRYRFSDEVISDLLASKWWEYDLPQLMAELQSTGQKLPFDNVPDFLRFMQDSDTSAWPRLADNWRYVVPYSPNQVQLLPAHKNLDMGHFVPESILQDATWY